jgi:hypothetical protein
MALRTVFSAALLLAAQVACACQCVNVTPKHAFQSAIAVFVAETLEEERGIATVRVEEAFKGVRKGQIVRVAFAEYGNCSLRDLGGAGAQNLLYAGTIRAGFSVSQCSRGRAVSAAACDISLLRSRSWWWRLPLSKWRIRQLQREFGDPCAGGG